MKIYLFLSLPGVHSMSLLEKDAGFCSGSSEHEDDHHSHDGLHSPTDASEDSVEVKFTPILKNKRKSSEPSRVILDPDSQGPLKKRFRYEETKIQQLPRPDLHRPWALAALAQANNAEHNPADILLRHPGVTTLHRAIVEPQQQQQLQDEPLALISKKPSPTATSISSINQIAKTLSSQSQQHVMPYENSIENLIKKTQINRLEPTKALNINMVKPSTSTSSCSSSSVSLPQVSLAEQSSAAKQKSAQRNYKNMTRERRIEANARERTRVHTISAAYDTLRQAVPSYSSTQKLSKLSVLRIACSYILTLSRLAGEDFSIDQSQPPLQDCIDAVTRTIQTEGKLRRKKDE